MTGLPRTPDFLPSLVSKVQKVLQEEGATERGACLRHQAVGGTCSTRVFTSDACVFHMFFPSIFVYFFHHFSFFAFSRSAHVCMCMLQAVSDNHKQNRMDAKNLSLIFGPIVFRAPASASLNSTLTDIPAVCSLVYLFITEYSRIFS